MERGEPGVREILREGEIFIEKHNEQYGLANMYNELYQTGKTPEKIWLVIVLLTCMNKTNLHVIIHKMKRNET